MYSNYAVCFCLYFNCSCSQSVPGTCSQCTVLQWLVSKYEITLKWDLYLKKIMTWCYLFFFFFKCNKLFLKLGFKHKSVYFATCFKGIVHSEMTICWKFRVGNPRCVDECFFIRFGEMYHFLTSGPSAVNGCRQKRVQTADKNINSPQVTTSLQYIS